MPNNKDLMGVAILALGGYLLYNYSQGREVRAGGTTGYEDYLMDISERAQSYLGENARGAIPEVVYNPDTTVAPDILAAYYKYLDEAKKPQYSLGSRFPAFTSSEAEDIYIATMMARQGIIKYTGAGVPVFTPEAQIRHTSIEQAVADAYAQNYNKLYPGEIGERLVATEPELQAYAEKYPQLVSIAREGQIAFAAPTAPIEPTETTSDANYDLWSQVLGQ